MDDDDVDGDSSHLFQICDIRDITWSICLFALISHEKSEKKRGEMK